MPQEVRRLSALVGALAGLAALTLIQPTRIPAEELLPPPTGEWNRYWYAGEAELNRYELHQNRYGEVRKGDAVLIFVTEDFLPETQVKYEGRPAEDSPVSVLKMNATRNFLTGIYPYSTMTSVFSPVRSEDPGAYKVTTSAQEWCGHVFMQLNRRAGGIDGRYFSYFQGEGDREFQLPDTLLEDEIWTRIRLNPAGLPTGELKVIPGSLFLRLMHREIDAYPATATLTEESIPSLSDQPVMVYRLDYQGLQRSVTIMFESAFPHAILAWEETAAPLGGRPGLETTRAVRTHAIKLDYWNHNGLGSEELRAKLGLQ